MIWLFMGSQGGRGTIREGDKKFVSAEAARVSLGDRQGFGNLAEFDALFIRETTSVNHHTYRLQEEPKLRAGGSG